MLKNTISGIIVGIVLTALSVYVFVKEPTQPTEGFAVEYKSSAIPTRLFLKVIREAIKDTGAPLDKIVKNYQDFLTGREELALVEYRISNESDRLSDIITANINTMIFGIIEDKDGYRVIEPGDNSENISIYPRSEARIWLVMNFSYYTSREKFLMNGFDIPISDKNINTETFPTSIVKDYPFITLSLSLVGATFSAAFIISILVGLISGSTPKFFSYVYSNVEIARSIALVNYIREEDEERYGLIVRRSERQFARWRKQKPD